MLRFYSMISIEITLAVFFGLVLILLRILRSVRRGKKAGVGWYAGALILVLSLAFIVFLTVKAGSQRPPIVTPMPWS